MLLGVLASSNMGDEGWGGHRSLASERERERENSIRSGRLEESHNLVSVYLYTGVCRES